MTDVYKMFYFANMCILCLSTYKNVKSVLIQDEKGISMKKKLKYCLPEIVDSHLDIPEYLCSNCMTKLDGFYKFKQSCLQHNANLRHYLQTLSSVDEKHKHISVTLTDIKYQNEPQTENNHQTLPSNDELRTEEKEDNGTCEETEAVLNNETMCVDVLEIKESHPILAEENDILVKKECLATEDNIDIEFNHETVKTIKCEPVSSDSEDCKNSYNSIENVSANSEECVISEDNGCKEFYPEFVKCEIFPSDSDVSDNENQHKHSNNENIFNNPEENNATEENVIKKFQCAICNKEFLHNHTLKDHLNVHAGVKNFSCSVCNRKFTRKDNMMQHEKIHAGIKNFSCLICNSRFVFKNDLIKHEIMHTGIKKFECSVCSKKFMFKDYLIKHEKIHTDVKEFQCSICKKEFMRKGDMIKHEKIHTDAKNFECGICKKKFIQKGNMIRHYKTHIGYKS